MVMMITVVITLVHVMQGDRESVKKVLNWVIVSTITLTLLGVFGGKGSCTWNINKGLHSIIYALSKLMTVALGIWGLLTSVQAALKVMKGERDSGMQMLYLVFAIAAGTVMINVLTKLSFG